MHPYLNIALRAVRKAGQQIIRGMERIDEITITEKQKNDFVTEIDQEAEAILIDAIHYAYPNHAILSEESGERPGTEEVTWIIDPLDGTTNYIHGFPHFAISIGIKQKNRLEHALIFDPLKQETFSASRGGGAHLNNNRRLRVSKQPEIEGSFLGTGFPYRELKILPRYLSILETIMREASGIRRAGSAALDLAYVAAGRLDGFWEFGLAPWDMAAGALLVKEAGGLVIDDEGGDDYLQNGSIIAGNLKITKALLNVIKSPTVL